MSDTTSELTGPDLTQGFPVDRIPDGSVLLGHALGEAVLLARRGSSIFAVAATCTHYGGPLAEGLMVGDTIRCPLHHACFSLRTGEALHAPALLPIACWRTERRLDQVFVTGKLEHQIPVGRASHEWGTPSLDSIVIVGGGAAGNSAAETLRASGFGGRISMIGEEASRPVDRPNLSKDYLAGTAPEDWLTLHPEEFYSEKDIRVVVGTRVTRIDPAARTVLAADGRSFPYDRLLIATGASPVRLPLPGAELPQIHLLRGLSDARALIARADGSRRAVVIGASFIGLEVAASLRARGLEVRVVAPEARPLERVLGPQLGDFVRELHEQHGVIFALGHVPTRIDPGSVTLDDGQVLPADLVVMGTGVRPNVELAEAAGLRIDKGIVVDSYLESSYPGIYAAGDVARYLDPRTGERVRIEHWAVAQRMGTTAARNMLGQQQAFDAVPYFWSQHYDVRISYVGHAEKWNRIDVSHGTDRKQWVARFVASGRTLAVATVGHDQISLQAEVTLEQWKPATAAGPSSPDRSGAGSAGIG